MKDLHVCALLVRVKPGSLRMPLAHSMHQTVVVGNPAFRQPTELWIS